MKRSFPPINVLPQGSKKLRLAHQLDEKIARAEASLRFSKSAANRINRQNHQDQQLILGRSKLTLFEETIDYHQLLLLVQRLRLSWSSVNCLIQKGGLALSPEKLRLQRKLAERDRRTERTLKLLREYEVARQRRMNAECGCRYYQTLNRSRWLELKKALGRRLPRPKNPALPVPHKERIMRHLSLCLATSLPGVCEDNRKIVEALCYSLDGTV